jgi:hypothetical protein
LVENRLLLPYASEMDAIAFVAYLPGIVGVVLLALGAPALIKSLQELCDARRQRGRVAVLT